MTKGGIQTTYTYDCDGIRRSKTVGTNETEYTLAGDKVVGMKYKVGGIEYRGFFTYDENGRPYSITMPGPDPVVPATYYYVLNLQGDVIKLVDAGGTAVVNYTYDAWGKIVSIKDEDGNAITSMTHVGRVNPFRYRGYIYDEETGFYYCKSRYYDPKIRRFINADALVSTCSGFLSYNMYAYCNNNPLNMVDSDGEIPVWIYADIHRKVLRHICDNNPELHLTDQKTFISGLSKKRYCDLYSTTTLECWELKHFLVDEIIAFDQLMEYTSPEGILEDLNQHLEMPTKTKIPYDHFYYSNGVYSGTVEYWDEGNGILRYVFISDKPKYALSRQRKSVKVTINGTVFAAVAIGYGLRGLPAYCSGGGNYGLQPMYR